MATDACNWCSPSARRLSARCLTATPNWLSLEKSLSWAATHTTSTQRRCGYQKGTRQYTACPREQPRRRAVRGGRGCIQRTLGEWSGFVVEPYATGRANTLWSTALCCRTVECGGSSRAVSSRTIAMGTHNV